MQNNMITYKVDKPERGAGVLEYILKYLTIFIITGFLIWAILIFFMTNGSLPELIYMISLYISFGLSGILVLYLVFQTVKKIKQGTVYQIDFDEKKQLLSLHLFNELKGTEFIETISYSSLRIEDKAQIIEIKAEQRLNIYNNSFLINRLNIPKTAWRIHPRIALIVETLREIANN